MDTFTPHLRPAQRSEAAALTDLTRRSKAHWGYSADFMAAAAAELVITPEMIRDRIVVVAEVQPSPDTPAVLCGYYQLCPSHAGTIELADLFIDPPWIGRGIGRLLFTHAVTQARDLGYIRLEWVSDPNAAGFYRGLGAQPLPPIESGIQPGRFLPRFCLPLT